MLSLDAGAFLTAFVALFVVMDPFSSVPVFLALTTKLPRSGRLSAARVAFLVAACVFLGFLLLGPFALSFLDIRLESFQIAGGILMLLIAISFALGIDYGKAEKTPVEAVLIGVPMLSGPGVMLTSILLSNALGLLNVLLAGLAACACSYFILLSGEKVEGIAGKSGLDILSRVMGVLLAAFAVEFIRKGMGL